MDTETFLQKTALALMLVLSTASCSTSRVQYRLKIKHDSIYINKTDTVFVKRKVTKTKLVPRKRTWFDWLCYSVTGAVLLFLLSRKYIKKIRTGF